MKPEQILIKCEQMAVGHHGRSSSMPHSFSVAAGERVAIVGRNGTGKSTLLRTLAGHLPPTQGKGEVLGMTLGACTAHDLARGGLSYVSDSRGVFVTLTVREHIELALGLPYTPERGREVTAPVSRVGERADLQAANLSGGERQALGIGCALGRQPKLLIVDELTHGVHVVTRAALLRRLSEASAATGLAIVFTDDHREVVEQLATRQIVCAEGHES